MSENSKLASVIYYKPNPCYVFKSYKVEGNTLKVFLYRRDSGRLCVQVLVKEELNLPEEVARSIEKVEVFTERGLWQVFEKR